MYGGFIPPNAEAAELRAAGVRIYNDWLADWTTAAPTRLFGVAYVPIWDVDEAASEVRRAHRLGLRCVNLPAPKVGLRTYNVREYDPLWAACQDTGMTLQSHVATGDLLEPDPGPGFYSMRLSEQEYAVAAPSLASHIRRGLRAISGPEDSLHGTVRGLGGPHASGP